MTFTPETLLPPPVQPNPEYSKVVANPETTASSMPSAEDRLSATASSKIPRSPTSSLARRNSVTTSEAPPSFANVLAAAETTDANPTPSQDTTHHEEATDSDGTVSDNPRRLDKDEFPSVKEASQMNHLHSQHPATENTQSSHLPFNGIVSRVAAIPTISETVNFMNESVTNVARKHRIVRLALNTTMRTVSLGASFAERLSSPVKPVLDVMDHQAVKVLDKVEHKFPIINRRPRDIVTTVSDLVSVSSDTAAHKVLEIRPIRSCVQLSATTLRSLNNGVDKVLHKTHIESPDQHSTIYTTVESLTRHVLGFVDETRNGDWRSKVEARRQSRCDLNGTAAQTGSSILIASYHGSEVIAA